MSICWEAATQLIQIVIRKGPFPLSDCDCDFATVDDTGVYGPISTGDCDVAIAIAKMGSVPIFVIAIS